MADVVFADLTLDCLSVDVETVESVTSKRVPAKDKPTVDGSGKVLASIAYVLAAKVTKSQLDALLGYKDDPRVRKFDYEGDELRVFMDDLEARKTDEKDKWIASIRLTWVGRYTCFPMHFPLVLG